MAGTRRGMTAAVLTILAAICLSGCSQTPPDAVNTGSPDLVTPSPVQCETPVPSDPMDEVYPVRSQEEAAQILERAYEGLVGELTFRFTQEDMSLQDRSILLQNASNQVLSDRPELKYAYALECTDGAEGTVCRISYMPYRLGYPDGVPDGAVEVGSLAELVEAANAALGGEEHMWNCALLDGAYRYFDTTWDAGRQDESQWRYFARTEEEFSQDHFWGIGQQELIHGLTGQ